MKFKINQNVLIEQLNSVIRGISTKNLIPILNCIKMELTEDGLYLTSNNNELAIESFISNEKIISVESTGILVVSGVLFTEYIKKLPNEVVTVEAVLNSKLLISSSTSSFSLNCNNYNDFPEIDFEKNSNPILITKKIFKETISQTIFAVGKQESRPVLHGINFNILKNNIHFTATDSYRLSTKNVPINENDIISNIIIPTNNLQEIVRLTNDDNEQMEIHIFVNKVIFKINNLTILSRLINGTYPNTSKLIPNDFKYSVIVELNKLFSAIDRASLLTSDDEKNTIKLTIKDNLMTISSNIPETGNAEEKIILKNPLEDEFKIAFSSKYMLDALRSLSCKEITLNFNNEISPIIIKDAENNDLTLLILPIRTY